MRHHFGKPKPVSVALETAVKELGIERKLKEQEVILRWKEIVGDAVARHSVPGKIENGLLRIHVPDAVWRQEIQLAREQMIRKINRAVGWQVVREIIVR